MGFYDEILRSEMNKKWWRLDALEL